jgi:glucosamine-6-phosphate deaminase
MRAPGPPRITVFPTDEIAARTLASRLAELLAAKLYGELAALHAQGQADFSRVTTFNLDEFLGIAPDHPGSFRTFMNTHFFSRVNLHRDRIHFLNGVAVDPAEECARYEREIAAAGGIDVQVLGVGTNGHIGFNEPAAALQARTHRVTLEPETRRANASLFGGDPAAVPAEALSVGLATILQARRIVLIATGAAKASIVERLLHGPITTEVPGSFLQLHPDVEIVMDEAAAADLRAS